MSQLDRRRHPRANVSATALVLSGRSFEGHYVVEDLSAGGARLVGAPPLEMGRAVRVLLRWPGRLRLRVDARVVRSEHCTSGAPKTILAFCHPPGAADDRIQNAVLAQLEEARTATASTIDETQFPLRRRRG